MTGFKQKDNKIKRQKDNKIKRQKDKNFCNENQV